MGAPLQPQEPAVAAASSSNQAPSKDALEATYSSLIQQHLSVLCVENATFLAERLVAMVESTNSLYLLAMCYYRSGNPRRAQAVLSGSTNQTPAMKYLLAKCLYDLEEYGAAEEVLLEECRMQYRQAFNPDVTDTETESMDEWILAETVRKRSKCCNRIILYTRLLPCFLLRNSAMPHSQRCCRTRLARKYVSQITPETKEHWILQNVTPTGSHPVDKLCRSM